MAKGFPLQLNAYFFIEQQISPIPSYEIDKASKIENKVSAEIVKNKSNYGCIVSLKLDDESSKNYPYYYDLSVMGIFENTNSIPDEIVQSILREMGVTLLIGAIRERIATATATGPWPACFLNFIPFENIIFTEEKEIQQDK